MESQRQRAAAARPERVVTPEAKARWNRAYKFSRLGISEERFNAVLEAQGYACGMCHTPFGDAFPHADHDHDCHEFRPKAQSRACEKCFRGLLCMRCNTALGYIELYGELARAYLASVEGGPRLEHGQRPAMRASRGPRLGAYVHTVSVCRMDGWGPGAPTDAGPV